MTAKITARVAFALIIIGALTGCVEEPATSWLATASGGGYPPQCPGCLVAATRQSASASVAHYGSMTTVTSSAGGANAAVATDGVSSGIAASAGGAHASVGATGSGAFGISTGAGNASASLGGDTSGSHGSTSAGNASISW